MQACAGSKEGRELPQRSASPDNFCRGGSNRKVQEKELQKEVAGHRNLHPGRRNAILLNPSKNGITSTVNNSRLGCETRLGMDRGRWSRRSYLLYVFSIELALF